ncbi:hypothetical protein TTHERM_00697070 (macronuclear) [Tetrahymena thermophila SB210]|uniref:Uncharacterized protein n=1 Tax=Tetrahymena thermophila (strain SB210) TaxID=312017 RepID=Q24C64_TETTS|nr:hypothetical protein TTHERM_00697070 [Tetrahymena thermophila SB210]EAS05374.2 hypothetical protein TTHERM_00697070 [Tetrahymena thermophila SB210]|eukprot:XP_001025619.2 hypothetical protein TTHERM_00697070 [Tetrahymena thermophila SB210]
MTQQPQKQQPIPIKLLQVENYLKASGKFYTNKSSDKEYIFKELQASNNKNESPFITDQQQIKVLKKNNNSYTGLSRLSNEEPSFKLKTGIDYEQNYYCFPKLSRTFSKHNLKTVDCSASIQQKKLNLPQINDINSEQLRPFMKSGMKESKLEMAKQKQLSHDFSLPFKVTINENLSLEKNYLNKNEDLTVNTSYSFANNNQKSKSSASLVIPAKLSQQESPNNFSYLADTQESSCNSQTQKQIRFKYDLETAEDVLIEDTLLSESSKFQSDYPKKSYDDQVYEKLFEYKQNKHQDCISRSNSNSNSNSRDEIKQNQTFLQKQVNKQKSYSLNIQAEKTTNKFSRKSMDQRYNQQDLYHYLNYLNQQNSLRIAQANLDNGFGQKKMEKNIEEHLDFIENILDRDKEQSKTSQKLKKVAQQILQAQQFKNQIGLMASLKKNRGTNQNRLQFKKDLEKFNSMLSPDHSIFIKEFFYTLQEFVQLISSNKRASLMIQQIRGFSPIIKQIIFIENEIRKDMTLELFEKQIISVMQFVQLKKEIQENKQKIKNQQRRKGLWFELSDESVKLLQFFYKNLREFVDQKNFDNKICMQSEFYQDLEQIEKIIYKYMINTNIDKNKYKNQCFKDLKIAYKEEIPYFVKNNIPLENLRYWERHLGKFEMVSDYVREKDQQITNMCKIYQNL